MDRTSATPELMALCFIAAEPYTTKIGTERQRMSAQWDKALGIADRCILESDRANPNDLDDQALAAIKKD